VPLFRRRGDRPPEPSLRFTVGTRDHRVTVGGAERGLTMLDELRGYIASVTGPAALPGPDGRDSVAVLSAKMDHAEMVTDIVSAVVLALEELAEQGVVPAGAVPPPPRLASPPASEGHYAYIQEAHRRAEARMEWLDQADAVLREHAAAVLPPAISG
jgi:hypothetical protein